MIENGILKPNGVIQLRGGTAANLTAVNPLLKNREIVVETDTGKAKIGDGTHRWNELAYVGGTLPVETSMNVTLTAQHISQKYIELPSNYDTSRLVTVSIQGILTEQDVDWEVSKKGTTDLIAWNGLELENIAQVGDKIFITYYKKG